MKKVIIVELNTYHDECLYSQIKFLKDSGYKVALILNKQILERTEEYSNLIDEIITYDTKLVKNIFRRVQWVFKQNMSIQRSKTDIVVFNTASSRLEVILLSNLLKNKVQLLGILHNLKKVNYSFSQKLINRAIKRFYVLNDFLEHSVSLNDKTIKLNSFYPIFFPKYVGPTLEKQKNEIWISIPGKLDFNRRDYDLIAEALKPLQSFENLKFLILGKTNFKDERTKAFIEKIKTYNLYSYFVFFENFLENSIFHEYLSKSDYMLLPLESVDDNYSKYKIMGCYNLAFGYKKSLICPKGLQHIEDISLHGTFYDNSKELSKIFDGIMDKKEKYKKTYSSKKWDYEIQKNKYIEFLENE